MVSATVRRMQTSDVRVAADHQRASSDLCTVFIRVANGFDGALRVAQLLRGRRYRVRDLAIEVRDGDASAALQVTVVLAAVQRELLLERLRRVPVVRSVDIA